MARTTERGTMATTTEIRELAAELEVLEQIDRLIAKAIEDVKAGRKGNALGKLGAARGNIILLRYTNDRKELDR